MNSLHYNVCSMKFIISFVFLLSSLTGFAGGKKEPQASISFHLEGAAAEAPKISRGVTTEAGDGFFRIVPEISNRDAIAFSSFPSKEDQTYGLVIKLNKQATRKLEVISTMNQGKLLLSIINGQPHGITRIDKPIKDGTLVIWRGVTNEHIRMYDQVVPRIGEDQKAWKRRLKEMKKKKK